MKALSLLAAQSLSPDARVIVSLRDHRLQPRLYQAKVVAPTHHNSKTPGTASIRLLVQREDRQEVLDVAIAYVSLPDDAGADASRDADCTPFLPRVEIGPVSTVLL